MKHPSVEVSIGSVRGGPPGITWVAAAERGLVRVQLGGTRQALLRELENTGFRCSPASAWEKNALLQIEEYYQGHRQRFTLPLWLEGMSDFQVRVVRALEEVPWGKVLTYGELASRVGSPGAARAIGGAMARNPLPLVVPCHRVLASGGGLGGFSGGLALKRALLRLEGLSPGS